MSKGMKPRQAMSTVVWDEAGIVKHDENQEPNGWQSFPHIITAPSRATFFMQKLCAMGHLTAWEGNVYIGEPCRCGKPVVWVEVVGHKENLTKLNCVNPDAVYDPKDKYSWPRYDYPV